MIAVMALAGRSAAQPVESTTVFCYRSLADVDCYGRPDYRRPGQLVGVYQRPLDDPADPLFWLERAGQGTEDQGSR